MSWSTDESVADTRSSTSPNTTSTSGRDVQVTVDDGAAGEVRLGGPEREGGASAEERETGDAGDDALGLVVHRHTFLSWWCARMGVSTSGRDVLELVRSGHVPPITPAAWHTRLAPGARVGMVTVVPEVTAGLPEHEMTGLEVAETVPPSSVFVSVATSVSTTSVRAIDPVLRTVYRHTTPVPGTRALPLARGVVNPVSLAR